jgi:hypothetical protein
LQWHGRLQRTVSGEAHRFDGKAALIEVLERMLFHARPQHAAPPAHTGSAANIARGGTKPDEANR